MLTIVGMFSIIVCASMFTACSQDDDFVSKGEVCNIESPGVPSYEIVQLSTSEPSDSAKIIPITRSTFNAVAWDYFPFLGSAPSSYLNLNPGVYAVKISVASGSSITIKTTMINLASSVSSYTWRYIFDSSNNQIYFSGSEELPYGTNKNYQHTIYAGESLVIVLHAKSSGNYYCYYRAI